VGVDVVEVSLLYDHVDIMVVLVNWVVLELFSVIVW